VPQKKKSALISKENHINVKSEWQQNADVKTETKQQANKLDSQHSTDFPTPFHLKFCGVWLLQEISKAFPAAFQKPWQR